MKSVKVNSNCSVILHKPLVESLLRKVNLKEGEEVFTLQFNQAYKYILLGYIKQDLYIFLMTNKRMILHKVNETTGHLTGRLITLDERKVLIGNMEIGVISLPFKEKKHQTFISYLVGVSEDYESNLFRYRERFKWVKE
ncbi:hypothetical protein [Bacillus toyonensis]|uniref:hypothetical protein n=1 Tax=Bacillus toyonensis TaxID=155322 RepID=UPI000BF26332|nr:hypothetical protein [Bacillus toyonensis]PGF05064.1 hypothetical protein COM61_01120 [Bacillus toyonensis]